MVYDHLTEQTLAVLPPARPDWLEAAQTHRCVPGIEANLQALDAAHEEEVQWAVGAWQRTGRWPAVSENSRFILRLRCGTAALMIGKFYCARTHATLFPPPARTLRATCAWLLTDWWELHGRLEGAKDLTLRFEHWEDAPGEK